MNMTITQVENMVTSGRGITRAHALELANTADLPGLLAAAGRIRKYFKGKKMDLCAIMNVKSGKCGENCRYCAQSSHYNTSAMIYPFVEQTKILEMAKEMEQCGVHRFAIVTSGGRLSEGDFTRALRMVEFLRETTKMFVCASLGNVTREMAVRLRDAGLHRYHHNLETSRSFFKSICDTHTYQDRVDTLKNVIEAGLEPCSGGIFGMGESIQDRLDMILDLRALGVKSIPVNILNRIKGTPLENIERIAPEEVLRTVAMYRFVCPDANIRYCGGRANLGDFQETALVSGADALMIGNYLTTPGADVDKDLAMIEKLGFEV